MVRVILCDDHPIFRAGLKNILAQFRDISVVAEVGTGADLLTALDERPADVVLLDISLPDMNGLDLLKTMAASGRHVATIVLSMHPEERYATRALKAGAAGYIAKESDPEVLITAIRKAVAGHRYVSPNLAERLASDLNEDSHVPPHERLSDREFQVMLMIAKGKKLKEISGELFLSPPTVATYRARILTKLKLQSTVDLIRYVLENHLME
jgi:DNA-binding NarL/FixJ family response regulator